MVVKSLSLETVCGITSRLPENSCPEVAFAGKSNVGKELCKNFVRAGQDTDNQFLQCK